MDSYLLFGVNFLYEIGTAKIGFAEGGSLVTDHFFLSQNVSNSCACRNMSSCSIILTCPFAAKSWPSVFLRACIADRNESLGRAGGIV